MIGESKRGYHLVTDTDGDTNHADTNTDTNHADTNIADTNADANAENGATHIGNNDATNIADTGNDNAEHAVQCPGSTGELTGIEESASTSSPPGSPLVTASTRSPIGTPLTSPLTSPLTDTSSPRTDSKLRTPLNLERSEEKERSGEDLNLQSDSAEASSSSAKNLKKGPRSSPRDIENTFDDRNTFGVVSPANHANDDDGRHVNLDALDVDDELDRDSRDLIDDISSLRDEEQDRTCAQASTHIFNHARRRRGSRLRV